MCKRLGEPSLDLRVTQKNRKIKKKAKLLSLPKMKLLHSPFSRKQTRAEPSTSPPPTHPPTRTSPDTCNIPLHRPPTNHISYKIMFCAPHRFGEKQSPQPDRGRKPFTVCLTRQDYLQSFGFDLQNDTPGGGGVIVSQVEASSPVRVIL